MRNIIIIMSLVIAAGVLFAQEPTLKIYLQDGSATEKTLRDIQTLAFKNDAFSSRMTIYRGNDSADAIFYLDKIDSITFVNDLELVVFERDSDFTYSLIDIDSVTIASSSIKIITIGEQVWAAKNLNVSLYKNGDSIRYCETEDEWEEAGENEEGAWCYYENDSTNGEIYGKLYNWHAVNDPRGLAPKSWHVPTDEDWKKLEMSVGMSQEEADSYGSRGEDEACKLAGRADLWEDEDLEDNDNFGTSGFLALPGGYRFYRGSFDGISRYAYFWTSSENNESSVWYRHLSFNHAYVTRRNTVKGFGYSVRLVRNDPVR